MEFEYSIASSKTNMASWTREVVCELIALYELNPCLYAVNTVDYHNKTKKNKAYEAIAMAISRLRPGTSAEDIKSKINGLRTQFMAENAKLKKSQHSGCSTDDIQEPSLWCYRMLAFLNSHLKQRNSTSNILRAHKEVNSSNEEPEWVVLDGTAEIPSSSVNVEAATEPSCNTVTESYSKKRKKELSSGEEFLSRASLLLENIKTSSSLSREDDVDIFGKFVAENLKQMKKKSRRRRAMLEVHKILLNFQEEEEDEELM